MFAELFPPVEPSLVMLVTLVVVLGGFCGMLAVAIVQSTREEERCIEAKRQEQADYFRSTDNPSDIPRTKTPLDPSIPPGRLTDRKRRGPPPKREPEL